MMLQEIQLRLTPEEAKDDLFISHKLSHQSKIPITEIHFKWKKRSIDARKKEIIILGTFIVSNEILPSETSIAIDGKNVSNSKSVAVIGFGPAGIYASLRLIERGYKPIVFERGKDVRSRRRDLAKLNKELILNPESNYCFGEGGAGTYSDGKLYTRSKKRGDVEKVLKGFVQFGAKEDILIDAHPHIGTNKLPQIIVAMRESILACGGEIHFNSKLTDFIIRENHLSGIVINESHEYSFDNVILATGHSARDIFYLLNNKNISIQAKPFALGVRIEHSQELIDKIQYHGRLNDDYLPPASYSLVTQVDGKGVFSFCMCPGGIVAPCATADGEVVTNGWSPSKRNNPYSNSGIVVSISEEDIHSKQNSPLVCLDFQKQIEQKAWEMAGKTQKVPAQRMIDFIHGKKSSNLPKSSYQPGLVSVDLNELFPTFISKRLKKALRDFGKKMPGYLTNDAVLHAPESRTSSPICIPRNPDTLQHTEICGLFPCAEGAGYAGGIVSAAVDGMNCADKVAELLDKTD